MRSCGSCFRVRGHEAAGNRGRVGPKTARTTLWRLEAGLKRGQAEFMQGIAACTHGLARAMRQKKRGAEAIVGRGWVQRCRSWLRIRSDLRARVRCASLAGRASASADKPDDPVGASSTKALCQRASGQLVRSCLPTTTSSRLRRLACSFAGPVWCALRRPSTLRLVAPSLCARTH